MNDIALFIGWCVIVGVPLKLAFAAMDGVTMWIAKWWFNRQAAKAARAKTIERMEVDIFDMTPRKVTVEQEES